MAARNCARKKWTETILGLGTSNANELYGKKTRPYVRRFSANKTIVLVDMACPMESNRTKKRDDKVTKYQQLCFEVRERREGYTVEVIPTIIGCLGGGMKELRTNIKRILKNYCDDNELDIIANEMQKTVLWESESIIRKTLSGLLT